MRRSPSATTGPATSTRPSTVRSARAEALRLSLNVPAVDLLDRVGPARFAARLAQCRHRAEAAARCAAQSGADPRRHRRAPGGSGRRVRRAAIATASPAACATRRCDRASIAACCRRARRGSCATSSKRNPRPGDGADTFDPRHRAARGLEDRHQLRLPRCLGARRHAALHRRRVGRPARRHAAARPIRRGHRAAAAVRSGRQPAARARRRRCRCRRRPTWREIEVCWPLGLPPQIRSAAAVPAQDEGMDAGRRGAADLRRTRCAPVECGPRTLRGRCRAPACGCPRTARGRTRREARRSRAGPRWLRLGCRRETRMASRLAAARRRIARRTAAMRPRNCASTASMTAPRWPALPAVEHGVAPAAARAGHGTGTVDRKPGSGQKRTRRTVENVESVEGLALSLTT